MLRTAKLRPSGRLLESRSDSGPRGMTAKLRGCARRESGSVRGSQNPAYRLTRLFSIAYEVIRCVLTKFLTMGCVVTTRRNHGRQAKRPHSMHSRRTRECLRRLNHAIRQASIQLSQISNLSPGTHSTRNPVGIWPRCVSALPGGPNSGSVVRRLFRCFLHLATLEVIRSRLAKGYFVTKPTHIPKARPNDVPCAGIPINLGQYIS